nr:serine/arginine repetitive matrix protein 3-like [Pongo abelii]
MGIPDSYGLSERSFEQTYNYGSASPNPSKEDGTRRMVRSSGALRDCKGSCARLQPAPGGSPRDRRLESRRRDSNRGSREEEPEEAAGGSGPGEGRARGCSTGGGAGRVRHKPASSWYHPWCRPRGRGQGTADPSLKRDANRQSWEKSLQPQKPSMLPPRAAPACTGPGEGATGRRRWPPEGVWDRTGCT